MFKKHWRPTCYPFMNQAFKYRSVPAYSNSTMPALSGTKIYFFCIAIPCSFIRLI